MQLARAAVSTLHCREGLKKRLTNRVIWVKLESMFESKRGVIGLDIGSRYLKLAQLNAGRDGYELTLFSMMPLEKDVISDSLVINKSKLVSSLKALISQAGLKKADVSIGLSGHSSVVTKVIKVPQITEEELSLNIKYEAEQYIPFDIKDVNIDFEIIGPDRDEDGMMDVMLVAAKKTVMDDYVDAVQQAGLTPVVVDIDCFALGNVYELNYGVSDHGTVALVNIGACKTNVCIIRNGQTVFTRDTAVGSNAHTDAIERSLAVTKEAAEQIKLGDRPEGVTTEAVVEIMDKTSDEIYAEIYRTFEYYRSFSGEEDINSIVLSGGAVLIDGFAKLMEERLGISVEVADVLRKLEAPGKTGESVRNIAPLAAVAVGLAMRSAGDRQ
jgi:type IV pilus assembly protein PilM